MEIPLSMFVCSRRLGSVYCSTNQSSSVDTPLSASGASYKLGYEAQEPQKEKSSRQVWPKNVCYAFTVCLSHFHMQRVAELLLRAGADFNALNDKRQRPIELLSKSGNAILDYWCRQSV